MDRRNFLKGAAAAALLLGGAGRFKALGAESGKIKKAALPAGTPEGKEVPDLVAVRGGESADMFAAALAALGGMEKFVKPGQKVVVKPNAAWNQGPDTGANTNPELVEAVVRACRAAGATEVTVFDHTCDAWNSCYRTSGIRDAVERAGGVMATGANQSDYREVSVPGAVRLKSPRVHRLVLDSDVFINLPVLKHHGGARLSCALKNLMGIVWDRRYMHANDLQQCIADAALIRKPDLVIVDACNVIMTGGPRGSSPRTTRRRMKMLLAGTDIVAVDTAACKLMGFPLASVPHIGKAERLGAGTTHLEKIIIRRIESGK